MKRILVLVLASAAVLATAPALALAHHHRARHHHSQRHHRRHHASHTRRHSRDRSWQGDEANGGTAGTVTSFSNGVLEITLSDGKTTETGNVTDSTELKCEAAGGDEQGDGNDGNDETSGQNDAGDRASTQSDDGGSDNGGDNESGEDGGDNGQMCSTANLTPGTAVRAARLDVSSGGAVWDEVEIVTS